MRIKSFLLFALIAIPALFWAQENRSSSYRKFAEFGPWIGLANYSGDVAQNRIVLGETKAAYGVVFKYHFMPHFDVRAHFLRGDLQGSDQNSSDPGIKARNFSFFSPLTEVGAVLEYNFIEHERLTGTGVFNISVSPYVFVGGAMAFIHPDVKCESPNCPTFPEPGQKRKHFTVPAGIGLRADLIERVSFSGEVGWRPTFADDIDGVSLYGNKNANDWYIFFGGTLSYVFGGQKTNQF